MKSASLRVLLVPESVFWVTGTLARSYAKYNPQLRCTILSGPVLTEFLTKNPNFAERFDLVHFVCAYASKEGLATFSKRIPVVTTHHHVTDWSLVRHNAEGDAIVCVSSQWLRDIEQRGITDGRAVLVRHGVDASVFTPATESERASRKKELGLGDGPAVGFFGKKASNDDDRKGLNVLHDAAIELSRAVSGTSVLLVGPGWRDFAASLRDAGVRAVWVPFVENHHQLRSFYAALDFYWVTARIEGGPVPLIEAMSCGICCVSTPVGTACDVIAHGVNGMLLSHDDPHSFAATTSELWKDRERRESIGRQARRAMIESYDLARASAKVIDAYRRAEEKFSERTGMRRDIDWPATPHEGATRSDGDQIPLDELSPSEKRLAARLEFGDWGDRLSREGDDRKAAASVLRKAWLTQPGSFNMFRTYLRHTLPLPLVRTGSRAKRALQRFMVR